MHVHRSMALGAVLLAAAVRTQEPGPTVVISEILASNVRTSLDDEGDTPDWIELHNASSQPADLAGWKLSDDSDKPAKWTLPRIVLPPDGRCLVWASGKDRTATPLEALVKSGAELPLDRTLIAAGAPWRYLVAEPGAAGPPAGWASLAFDDASWLQGPSGFGYADEDDATVLPEGTTAAFTRRRFTVADPGDIGRLLLRIRFDDGFVAYLNGTRVAASNSPVDDPDFSTIASDKHEAAKAEPFDLTPHLRLLRAGENVLAIAGLNDRPSTDMSLIAELGTTGLVCHTSFELNAAGGEVVLSRPDGTVADRLDYPRQAEDRSYGRPEGAAQTPGHFVTPSPGLPNRFRAFPEPPEVSLSFDPPPGAHAGAVTVRVAARSSAPSFTLRYTLDGSEPAASSPELREPLRLGSPTVVRAAVFIGAERAAPDSAATYLVGERPLLPVLSVSLPPEEFVEVHVNQNAHGRPAERRAHLEVFAADGQRVAATVAGLRLHGGYGRRGGLETKKSYKLYFRGFYGDGRLKYPLIPGAPEKGLDKIVLRANFNDRLGSYHAGAAFIRDQVLRDLHRDMGALAIQGTWCLLHVNGEAKGLYNAVERPDDEMLAGHLGGDWDVIKTGNELAAGTREAWDALRRYALEHDISQAEHYEELQQRVDLESFTAYMILNLWSQNEDWPANNWYAVRPRREGGKWFFLSWDAEWGLGNTPAGHQARSFQSFFANKSPLRDLFAALSTNAAYRAHFQGEVARHLAGALRPENVEAHVDRQRNAIAAVVPLELRLNAGGFPAAAWKRNVETVRQFASLRNPYFERLVARTLEPPASEEAAAREKPVALARAATGELWLLGRVADGGLDAFRRAGEGAAWTRVAIDVGAARLASGVTGYVRHDLQSLHVLYRGEDGHIHQWSQRSASGDGADWQHEDLTELTRTAPAAGPVHAIYSSVDGSPHVVYRDGAGHLHELWHDTAWRHACIGAAAAAPRLTTGSVSLLVDAARKSFLVTYVGEDGHVNEISSSLRAPAPGKARSWQHVDLMKDQGAMPSPGLVMSTTGPKTHRIHAVGPDGLPRGFIEQGGAWLLLPVIDSGSLEPLRMRPGSAHAWQPQNADGAWLLAFVEPDGRVRLRRFEGVERAMLGLPAFRGPSAAGDPFAWSDAQGAIHVAYRGTSGAWHHVAPVGGKWQAEELR